MSDSKPKEKINYSSDLYDKIFNSKYASAQVKSNIQENRESRVRRNKNERNAIK